LQLLDTSVIGFYLPQSLDKTNGGFLENLGANGQFVDGGGKFLTLQARQIWTFSTCAERGIRKEECLAAAKHGFEFLQKRFYDADHGGYFNQLNDDGTVRDDKKHAYLNSFALYALVAYHRVSSDPAALKAAMELFETLEQKAYDRKRGGYQEYFHRDWRPITDPAQAGIVGAVGTKTYNTHLHLMESFTELYRVTNEPRVRDRLTELLTVNTVTVQHSQYPCNIDGWSLDWKMIDTPTNLRASYGHDVECVWLALDTARSLDWSDQLLKQWGTKLVEYSMKHGYDHEHGGFFYTGPLGQPATDRHKEWWVQAEALVCMLEMYQLTGEETYWRAFDSTFEFVKNHQVAQEGGWWAARQADGSPSSNRSRTSMWQGAYHGGRALLRCSDLLQQLSTNQK
jgi:mannobiose 2-epimerase